MQKEWEFDLKHSAIRFHVRYMLVAKVHGRFTRWGGWMRFNEHDPTASALEVQIDAGSIDTLEPERDAHLRSADFLDAASFSRITFKSTQVEQTGSRFFNVKGDLTIRGVTRPTVLEVEYGGSMRDPFGEQRVGFSARTSIDRKDFGVSFNHVLDHGGLALGEQVTIEIDVEATREVGQVAVAI